MVAVLADATTAPVTYSTAGAAEAAGITYRQLDHWIRSGWVPAPTAGDAWRRRFTERDVAVLRVVARLARIAPTRELLPVLARALERLDLSGVDVVYVSPAGAVWAPADGWPPAAEAAWAVRVT